MAPSGRVAAFIIGNLCFCGATRGGRPEPHWVYKICNGNLFKPNAFEMNRNVLLYDLATRTQDQGYNYYASEGTGDQACYGHAACNGVVSRQACDECLGDAAYLIQKYCYWSIGAQFQLENCRIRYENYAFQET